MNDLEGRGHECSFCLKHRGTVIRSDASDAVICFDCVEACLDVCIHLGHKSLKLNTIMLTLISHQLGTRIITPPQS